MEAQIINQVSSLECLVNKHYCCNYLEKPMQWVKNVFYDVGIRYIPEWRIINGIQTCTGGGYSLRHLTAVKYPEAFIASGEYDLQLFPNDFILACKRPTSAVPPARLVLYNKFNGHCSYCGTEIKTFLFHVDHIIPKSKFRQHVSDKSKRPYFLTHLNETDIDHPDNILPCCTSCNGKKGRMHLEYFREKYLDGRQFYFEKIKLYGNDRN